jgi:septum formation protein
MPQPPSPITVYLASQSPRRKSLLESVGITPVVMPADPAIDAEAIEIARPNEDPIVYVTRVANLKRDMAQQRLQHSPPETLPRPQTTDLILAADTTVALHHHILGKPDNTEHARQMLMALSGKVHQVHTAVSIATVNGDTHECIVVSSDVYFADVSQEWIANYIATGEPMDKAGSYGIQGIAGSMIPKISGSYTGIMGLPLFETLALIRKLSA